MDKLKEDTYLDYLCMLVIFLCSAYVGAAIKGWKVKYDTKTNIKNMISQKVKDPKWQTMHEKGDYTEIYRAYIPTGWIFIVRQDGVLRNSIVIKDPQHKWL